MVSLSIMESYAQTFPVNLKENRLEYSKDAKGNRVLDFSYCGYRNSNVDIPNLPVVVSVSPAEGDNSPAIQRAINYVSSLKPNADGFRGAVLLEKGMYSLDTPLRIRTSGVVLRGEDKAGTILVKRGFDRGAAVYVEGDNDLRVLDTLQITSDYVPVNSLTLEVSSAAQLKVGDKIRIYRPSEADWIASIGCNYFGGGRHSLTWEPGDVDLLWDRSIVQIDGNRLTLNAPLSMALDKTNAASKVLRYTWNGRIADSGVENMTFISDFDQHYPKDENHAWTGVYIDNAENCWVRNVTFRQFAGSVVAVQYQASNVTVEDCIALEPASEVAGFRRRTFYTLGQHTLFQRCYSEHGVNDFSAGQAAAGPNAFVQCDSKESKSFSGSTGSWACGLLFDLVNIDGHNLVLANLEADKNGLGWNSSNSMLWQCTAAEVKCYSPASDARNYAYGCWGQFYGNGEWGATNDHVKPRSLFHAQLSERLNRDVSERTRILPRLIDDGLTSPTVEQAMYLMKKAHEPRLTLDTWINQTPFSASVSTANVKNIRDVKFKEAPQAILPKLAYGIENGRLVANHRLLVGDTQKMRYWRVNLGFRALHEALPHVSRFVPGMEVNGTTDRIDSVLVQMKRNHSLIVNHNYGLWYERRRDDHERIRRRNSDVWAPFFDQPFARSGQGAAWEGMSLYDLTRPNTWYWGRLKEYADKAETQGLLLFHQNYFQHNIIEAGAHWVDSPWRSVNNINQTGFPEPVNFAGDKRVFVADMFYDVTHPVRRELHRNYIRWCLDNFADNKNVIQFISSEYTGPLHFVQFWLDCIAEWKQETGKEAIVALSTTKDVQDAILNDPKRAALINFIDIRFWHYRSDGSLYAPEGGKNMSPRQHARQVPVGELSYESVYKAVSEYRTKYPQKAVLYYAQNYADYGWAVLMAGGSCPVLNIADEELLAAIPKMIPIIKNDTDYQMLAGENGAIIYTNKKQTMHLSLPEGTYTVKYIHPLSGEVNTLVKKIKLSGSYTLEADKVGAYWLQRLR